jgi:phage repressor protein C with HTH and peptisase S24 domain
MNKYERLKDNLTKTGMGLMKVFGNSMMPKIKSGSTLTFQVSDVYQKGDVVFSKVGGKYIDAHQITKVAKDGRYLISNNKGHDNGWTRTIYGKVVKIEDPT